MKTMTRVVLLFLLIAAVACGDEPADDTANHATDDHTLTVDGWTVDLAAVAPPLNAGEEVFELTVTDAKGATVEPDEFEVDAFMSAHGHGTMVPTVTEKTGAGLYEAIVTFSMPGPWEVRVNTDDDRFYEFDVEVEP